VNEKEIITDMPTKLKHSVQLKVAHLQEYDWIDQINLIRQTDLFIYVHGAAMVNLLFLPAYAKVITLYQWCQFHRWEVLNDEMAYIHGLRMFAWTNTDRNKTSFQDDILYDHVECHLVKNMTETERDVIRHNVSYSTNPPMCAQTYWLNQNTVVDVNALTELVDEATQELCDPDYKSPLARPLVSGVPLPVGPGHTRNNPPEYCFEQ
jgi:hypothetical protein